MDYPLTQKYDGFACKQAYKWLRKSGCGCESDDLIQLARIGMMEAEKRFDPKRGFKFITYAAPWITKYLRQEVFYNSRVVNTTRSQSRDHGIPPLAGSIISITQEDGSINERPLGYTEPANGFSRDAHKRLHAKLRVLSKNQRYVLVNRACDRSAGEIGRDLGLSRAYVHKVESEALARLGVTRRPPWWKKQC